MGLSMAVKEVRYLFRKIYSGDRLFEFGERTLTISSNVKLNDKEILNLLKKLLLKKENPVRITMSICPKCADEKKWAEMRIPALIFEKDKKVMIRKECPKHGIYQDAYWEDSDYYFKQQKFADQGLELSVVQVDKPLSEIVCPNDCGLCKQHKSHTALANLVVTNRCDLSCWYCFFFQKMNEPVYEPSLDAIRAMLKNLRNEKPIACNAIQLTGGEPTLREDIVEIVKMCKEEGFEHVQFNTNGIRLATDAAFVEKVVRAGANIFYMSFDGVTPKTNPKNYWEAPKAIENVRKTRAAGIVLVPTIINGFNTHELGDIIRFAASQIDVVRGVNMQPVSLVGMMPKNEREKQRITIPRAIKLIEEQTNGEIGLDDFYCVPCVGPITNLIETLTGKPQYRLSSHFACGAGTYVFIEGKRFLPITRFVDVEGLFEYLQSLAGELRGKKLGRLGKLLTGSKILYRINSFIDQEKKPKNLKLSDILAKALLSGNYNGLKEFHYNSLFIGMMHFMDPYDYDIDRVERCCIHYAMPDNRIVPFCAFNVIPDLYRDAIQKKHSVQAKDWEKLRGKKLCNDKYRRNISKEEQQKIDAYYKENIDKFK
ncbi:MAG: radical SAM protein [Candidatus Diapherotrites archaeon]|nr:radical SAM protein [Candidatus Diapherotrites archaeon]